MPYHDTWYTDIGYRGLSLYQRDQFCVPTVHPRAPTSPFNGALIIKHLSLSIFWPYCLKMLAPIVGLVGAVGRYVKTQKWFLRYIDQAWYPISVYQVSW